MSLLSLKAVKRYFSLLLLSFLIILPINFIYTFAYIFANTGNGLDVVAHPIGYTGTGGVLNINVAIAAGSPNEADMVAPVQNVIATVNNLTASNDNLTFSFASIGGEIPNGSFDFESVLLHEMGHSLGLAHVNAATESGLSGTDREYTKADDGIDNTFNLNSGTDGIIGSDDDVRGDDVNLNYFKIADNNPFTDVTGTTVDNTTYSRNILDLPAGDIFSTNAERDVATLFGLTSCDANGGNCSECSMQQGTFNNEIQRVLGFDDVAGLRYAMAGVDETQGTADDYTINLNYVGIVSRPDANVDIFIEFDDAETGFAVSQSSGTFINATHIRITANNIYFNNTSSWYFNTVLPVELLDFLVKEDNKNAVLEWTTATEVNHSHFEIQKSFNLKDWEAIGDVSEAYNEVNSIKKYVFTDKDFAANHTHVYYRLKSIDLDGTYDISEAKLLNVEVNAPVIVAISPVPMTKATTVEMDLPDYELVNLRLFDITGKTVENWEFEGVKGINSFQIGQRLDVQSGIYFLEIQTGGFVEVRQVVK